MSDQIPERQIGDDPARSHVFVRECGCGTRAAIVVRAIPSRGASSSQPLVVPQE